MLTLQFVPYGEIEYLSTNGRISKLLGIVKENKIVIMQGRLEANEENKLIEKTMEEIGNSKFKGIEICTVYPKKSSNLTDKFKKSVAKVLLGNRDGITIIGPASLVKEIKKDPNKIQLFTKEVSSKKKRKR